MTYLIIDSFVEYGKNFGSMCPENKHKKWVNNTNVYYNFFMR